MKGSDGFVVRTVEICISEDSLCGHALKGSCTIRVVLPVFSFPPDAELSSRVLIPCQW